jgi:hypothetical protein
MGRVRGRNLIPLRAFVKEKYGDKGWAAVLAGLSPKAREVMEGLILEDNWYDRAVDVEAVDAILRLAHKDDATLARQLAARIADHHERVYMRPVLKQGPLALLRRAAAEWREYYQGGTLSVIETRERGVRLELHDPEASDLFCGQSLPGFLEAVLRLGGAKDVHARQTACRYRGAPCCEIEVDWGG